jgi:hypothetical protein
VQVPADHFAQLDELHVSGNGATTALMFILLHVHVIKFLHVDLREVDQDLFKLRDLPRPGPCPKRVKILYTATFTTSDYQNTNTTQIGQFLLNLRDTRELEIYDENMMTCKASLAPYLAQLQQLERLSLSNVQTSSKFFTHFEPANLIRELVVSTFVTSPESLFEPLSGWANLKRVYLHDWGRRWDYKNGFASLLDSPILAQLQARGVKIEEQKH